MSTGRDLFLISNNGNSLSGVTTWMHQMARLFQSRGHRVHTIGMRKVNRKHPAVESADYPVTFLYESDPPLPWKPSTFRDRFDRAAQRREAERIAERQRHCDTLSRLFSEAQPGGMVIVAQVWAMHLVAEADTAGLPVIGMNHNSFDYTRQFGGRFRRIQHYFRDVERFLSLTREDADRWIGEGMDNAGAMPNALPFLPEESSPREEKAVISVGRLNEQKGLDLLLETWARVAPHRPGWKLRIYGSGPDSKQLKRQCTALGLDDSVQWKGRTHDVPGALRKGSVFVQSSRGEGFPLTLMEAMATGLPCAAFDCAPGVREIVRDGEDGLLAPPGEVETLADRLLALTGDQELRDTMGERARVNVQRFSEREIAEEWERLFALLEA